LVLIPAGEFLMGDPPRRARIDEPFWMGALEITNAQYATFDPAHSSRLETGDFLQFSPAERGYPTDGPDQPVCRVSWAQAMAFCEELSKRTGLDFSLPTDAQWEWAYRAGSDGPMWYGERQDDFAPFANLADVSLRRVDTFSPWALPSGAVPEWRQARSDVDDGHRVSASVGAFRPNAWGLYDMAGNVAEWTLSPATGGQTVSSRDASARRLVCGGSWYDMPARATAAHRTSYPGYRGIYDVGFRVIAREVKAEHGQQ
jgi:formylglycine-generating enzyme required for sulfatase activity